MKNKNTKIIIGIIIVLAAAWWGYAMMTEKENTISPTEIENIGEQVKGNINAEFALVEFSEFQCPACVSVLPMFDEVLKNFDNVKLVYKHYPLQSIHPNAQIASVAAESAGLQGEFWGMHDILYAEQRVWSNSINPKKIFIGYAEDLGLDVIQFEADFKNPVILEKIKSDTAEGDAIGVRGTPSIYLNGIQVSSYNEIVQILSS